jgi:hypothetical protein
MKKLLLLIGLLFVTSVYSQDCYSVKDVKNNGEIEGINPKRFTMGVKQITEEILSVNKTICEDGKPVSVLIESIEAPSTGISLGPFERKRKKTVVTLVITIDGKEYRGVGDANTDVKSTFIELQDENLPFEKSAFSSALKKGIQEALSDF